MRDKSKSLNYVALWISMLLFTPFTMQAGAPHAPQPGVCVAFNGDYTVGTGGYFSTLKEAADCYNTAGISANSRLIVISDITETATVEFLGTAPGATNYSLTITSDGARHTISGNLNAPLMKLTAANNIIIDGIYTATEVNPTAPLLVFSNTYATASATAWALNIAKDASNNSGRGVRVRNAEFQLAVQQRAPNGGTVVEVATDSVFVKGCHVHNGYTGIYDNKGKYAEIQNNIVTNIHATGIYAFPVNGTSNLSITGNVIKDMLPTTGNRQKIYGIYVYQPSARGVWIVSNNKIDNLNNQAGFECVTNGIHVYSDATMQINGNKLSNLRNNSTSVGYSLAGINLVASYSTSVQCYNDTIVNLNSESYTIGLSLSYNLSSATPALIRNCLIDNISGAGIRPDFHNSIGIFAVGAVNINANRISNVKNTADNNNASAFGMCLYRLNSGYVSNNMVSNVAGRKGVGIFGFGIGVNLYHNNVRLTAKFNDTDEATTVSLGDPEGNLFSNIKVQNNILSNEVPNGSANNYLLKLSTIVTYTLSDNRYNIVNGNIGYLGSTSLTYPKLSNWQAAIKDNSRMTVPAFASANDLHLAAPSNIDGRLHVPRLSVVLADFDGDTRALCANAAGADNFDPSVLFTVQNLRVDYQACTGDLLQINFEAVGGVPPYQYSLNGGTNYTTIPAVDSITQSGSVALHAVIPALAGNHSLLLRDANNCIFTPAPFTIQFPKLNARNDSATVTPGVRNTINVLANDSLLQCTSNSVVSIIRPALHGNTSVTLDNRITYSATDYKWYGVDSLKYLAACTASPCIMPDSATVYVAVVRPYANLYQACPGSSITVEMFPINKMTYQWYATQTGGTTLAAGDAFTLTMGASDTTVWVEPRYNDNGVIRVFPRYPVTIHISPNCGAGTGCLTNGRLLFKEDFGKTQENPYITCGPALPSGITNYTFGNPEYDGNYSICAYNVNLSNYWYTGARTFDHTIGDFDGYSMIVNADYVPGKFYTLQIDDLCPNTKLYFSAWVFNLMNPKGAAFTSGGSNINDFADPDLLFELTDAATGNVLSRYTTGAIPKVDMSAGEKNWRQYGFEFTPGSSESVILTIYNNAPGGNGNDLMLDDIAVYLCIPSVSVPLNPAACEGTGYTLTSFYTDDGTFGTAGLQARVEHSADGQTNWTAVTSGVTTSITGNLFTIHYTMNNVTLADSGYYRVLVGNSGAIDKNQCRAQSDVFFFKVNKAPTASIVPFDTAVCTGENAAVNVVFNGSKPYGLYYTENGMGKTITANSDTLSLAYFAVSTTINIVLDSLKDNNTCAGYPVNARAQITAIPLPVVTITTKDTSICAGSSIDLSTLVNAGNNEQSLLYTDTTGAALPSSIVTPTAKTTYYVKISNTLTGCISSGWDSLRVNLYALPVVNIITRNTTTCEGKRVDLASMVSVNANEQASYYIDTTAAALPSSIVDPNISTTYYVKVTNTVTGCTSSAWDSLRVYVNPAPTHSESAAACQNTTFTWRGIDIPTSQSGQFVYIDTLPTAQGCDSILILNMEVYAAPAITSLTATATTQGGVMVLSPVTLQSLPPGYLNYLFTLNSQQVYNGANNTVTVKSPLYYNKRSNHATVEVTDGNGCKNTESIDFDLKVIIPNTFTPDGDGYNDFFLKGYDIKIFNRYGHVLYRGKDGWDGRYKGQDMPEGTYFYELHLPVGDNDTETFAGSVLLERTR